MRVLHAGVGSRWGLAPPKFASLMGWWDCLDPTNVTVAGGLVTGWADISGNARNISGGTVKPCFSRTDTLSNLLTYSEDVTQAAWVATSATKNDATHYTFTAQNGNVAQTVQTYATRTYTCTVNIRKVTGNTALTFIATNAASGATAALNVTTSLANYSFNFTGRTGNGLVTIGVKDGNAAGFGQVEMATIQVRETTSSSTYVTAGATPEFPRVGSVAQSIVFYNSQYLETANNLTDFFGTQAKTLIFYTVPYANGITQNIASSGTNACEVQLSGTNTTNGIVNDGAAKTASIVGYQRFTPYCFSLRHNASNVIISSGSNKASTAAGASASLASVLRLGLGAGGANPFHGRIFSICAFNAALADSECIGLENYLIKRFA